MKNIFHDCLVTVELIEADADNASYSGAGVDMQGFEGVAFILAFGDTESGGYTIKAQQDTTSGFGTAADLEGPSILCTTVTTGNLVEVLDIYQPQERYVRAVVAVPNLTTAQEAAIIAIRYGAHEKPQTNVGEFHPSPSEGTA